MRVNDLKRYVMNTAWDIVPECFLSTVLSPFFKTLNSTILKSGIQSTTTEHLPDVSHEVFRILLEDGTQLFSGPASSYFTKIVSPARKTLGIDPKYSKALVDCAVRYTYPHSLVPILDIPNKEYRRRGFHLQHKHLPQKTQDFDAATRNYLKSHFTPTPGWRVLDIGCFLGHGTLQISKMIGHTGRLIAVEAIKENAAIASYQLSANGQNHSQVLHRAIWHTGGEVVSMNAAERQANAIASDVVASSNKIDVTTTSIADLTVQLGGPADLISLTVNGAEIEALESLSDMAPQDLPARIVMPGWYKLGNIPRSTILSKKLRKLGYSVLVTSHQFVIAFKHDMKSE